MTLISNKSKSSFRLINKFVFLKWSSNAVLFYFLELVFLKYSLSSPTVPENCSFFENHIRFHLVVYLIRIMHWWKSNFKVNTNWRWLHWTIDEKLVNSKQRLESLNVRLLSTFSLNSVNSNFKAIQHPLNMSWLQSNAGNNKHVEFCANIHKKKTILCEDFKVRIVD